MARAARDGVIRRRRRPAPPLSASVPAATPLARRVGLPSGCPCCALPAAMAIRPTCASAVNAGTSSSRSARAAPRRCRRVSCSAGGAGLGSGRNRRSARATPARSQFCSLTSLGSPPSRSASGRRSCTRPCARSGISSLSISVRTRASSRSTSATRSSRRSAPSVTRPRYTRSRPSARRSRSWPRSSAPTSGSGSGPSAAWRSASA